MKKTQRRWRPEYWLNPYLQQDERGDFINSRVFEAGADAMLEALRNKPYKVIEWDCPVCGSERLVCDSCLVNRKFSPIPNEEEDEGIVPVS